VVMNVQVYDQNDDQYIKLSITDTGLVGEDAKETVMDVNFSNLTDIDNTLRTLYMKINGDEMTYHRVQGQKNDDWISFVNTLKERAKRVPEINHISVVQHQGGITPNSTKENIHIGFIFMDSNKSIKIFLILPLSKYYHLLMTN